MTARTLTDQEAEGAQASIAEWATQAPGWLQASRAVDVDGDQPWAGVSVFDEAHKLCALIGVSEAAPGVFEIHLDAARNVDGDKLARIVQAVVEHLKSAGALLLVCWTLRQNRRITEMAQQCGAAWDGNTRRKGIYRGQLFEWRRYVWQKGLTDVETKANDNN